MSLEAPIVVKSYKLLEPINHGGRTVDQLDFIKMKAVHLKNMEASGTLNDPIAMGLNLLSILTNQPPVVIESLCMDDYYAAQEIVQSFLPKAR